ncbi:universal stress protein [Yinghuangia seranimata]|uniref:universal stress protein n=1 Tax=Yinghuangia seranimata TaxID=408067 RepID=UPI00248AB1F3|nr:universal stress protein [Yinghuangia seranimata]MDI2124762.1 universal stress protein [Yinghuangia seranimata]
MMERQIRRLSGHVVVGVDDSPAAAEAVTVAAEEAARAALPLEIVHAVDPARYRDRSGPAAYTDAHTLVDRAAEAARRLAPWLDVETTVVHSAPDDALLGASDTAALVVVGSRGLGALAGAVLRSVGASHVARSRCPVLIVPPGLPAASAPPRPVLVGVSGPACRPAVEAALRQAALRGTRLTALHAWSVPVRSVGFSAAARGAVSAERVRARARLAEVLEPLRGKEPGVRVRESVVRDAPGRALVEASGAAGLLVVGARQRPPGPGAHIGPVMHALLHRTRCPLLVVPVV